MDKNNAWDILRTRIITFLLCLLFDLGYRGLLFASMTNLEAEPRVTRICCQYILLFQTYTQPSMHNDSHLQCYKRAAGCYNTQTYSKLGSFTYNENLPYITPFGRFDEQIYLQHIVVGTLSFYIDSCLCVPFLATHLTECKSNVDCSGKKR